MNNYPWRIDDPDGKQLAHFPICPKESAISYFLKSIYPDVVVKWEDLEKVGYRIW